MSDTTRPPYRIDSVFVFIAADENGDEGLIGCEGPHGWVPFVCGDLERVEQLRPLAQDVADATGRPVTLRYLGTARNVETLIPRPPAPPRRAS